MTHLFFVFSFSEPNQERPSALFQVNNLFIIIFSKQVFLTALHLSHQAQHRCPQVLYIWWSQPQLQKQDYATAWSLDAGVLCVYSHIVFVWYFTWTKLTSFYGWQFFTLFKIFIFQILLKLKIIFTVFRVIFSLVFSAGPRELNRGGGASGDQDRGPGGPWGRAHLPHGTQGRGVNILYFWSEIGRNKIFYSGKNPKWHKCYCYCYIWHDDIWYNDICEYDVWDKNIWNDDIWDNNIWHNDVWDNIIWHDDIWDGNICNDDVWYAIILHFSLIKRMRIRK